MTFTPAGLRPGPPQPAGGFSPAAVNAAPPTMQGGWSPHAITAPDGVVRPGCLTVANVDVYFQDSPRNADWQALTLAEKGVAVNQACRWLNTLCWDITLDCCDRDFAYAWEMAFSELALWLHQNPAAIITGPGDTQSGTFVSKQKLGDLEINYDQFSSSLGGASASTTLRPRVSRQAPLILQKAPWLVDILGCWLTTNWKGTRRMIPVDRN